MRLIVYDVILIQQFPLHLDLNNLRSLLIGDC
jgi:hypothetical protein